MMKVAVIVLACIAVAVARDTRAFRANGPNQQLQSGLNGLIHREVLTILKADPNLTIDHCTTKCDALFSLPDADEKLTDNYCKFVCDCEINKTCPHHVLHPNQNNKNNQTKPTA